MLATVALNTNTILVCLVLLLFIGKFFCVSICETLYEAIEDEDNELFGMFIIFWIISAVLTPIAWVGKYFDSEIVMVISLAFASLFSFFYTLIMVCIGVARVIIPAFEDLHERIKAKKRGM